MYIKKLIKFLSFAILTVLISCSQPCIQTGDLLFVGIPQDYSLDGSSIDNAIASATGDGGQINYIHVAILEVENGQTWVIDATIKHGVDRHPLDTFLTDFTLKDGSLPLLDVRRVENISVQQAQAAVEKAKTFVGKSYDFAFLPDNDSLYCSELVQRSYLDAHGCPIFPSKPMNFKDADGNMPVYWEQLFAILGMPVPQGVAGTNPQDMLASPLLKKVCVSAGGKVAEQLHLTRP